MPLFVERAQDKWGNRGYTPAVVEGTIVKDKYGTWIKITAPAAFVKKWSDSKGDCRLRRSLFTEVLPAAGPARILNDWEDNETVIQKYRK